MAKFKFEIKMPIIPAAGFFSQFFNILDRLRPEAEQKIISLLNGFDNYHYQKRSGDLLAATKVEGTLDKEIKLYVDMSEVAYGGWILTGQRNDPRYGMVYWDGDPFIDNNINENQTEIDDIIRNWINDSVKQWNNS